MTTRSIIDIDVNSDSFKRFSELFDAYNAKLAKMPGQWSESGKAMTASLMAQSHIMSDTARAESTARKKASDDAKKEKDETERLKRESESTSRIWLDMGRHTGTVARNISSTTTSLLKWGTLTGIFTGLLGAGGGLFGIDMLARSATNTAGAARGFGMTPGQLTAMRVNYKPFFDADTLAGNVANSQNDPTKWLPFVQMGISNFRNKDPFELSIEVAKRAAQIAGQTPNDPQQWRLRGLTAFFSPEQLRKMQYGLSDAEAGARGDVAKFDVSPATSDAWRRFTVKLDAAGRQIETTFKNSLVQLENPLEHLSKATVDLVTALGSSPRVKKWLDEIADALEHLAGWLDKISPSDIDKDVEKAQVAGVGAGGFLLGGPPGALAALAADAAVNTTITRRPRETTWGNVKGLFTDRHNPGNLRSWGDTPIVNGFAQFGDDASGLKAMSDQLMLDQRMHHQDTLQQLIYGNAEWGGYTATNQSSYLAALVKGLGVGKDDKIDMSDPAFRAKLMALMTKQEGHSGYSPEVVLKVLNQTGGSAVVDANLAAPSVAR